MCEHEYMQDESVCVCVCVAFSIMQQKGLSCEGGWRGRRLLHLAQQIFRLQIEMAP